jgi:hypothetical protein
MAGRRFPRPWRFEPIPGGYRVIDANGLALAHVYGQTPDAVAFSDKRLTDDEARRILLIVRLPELVELEQDRNKARSRRKPQPLRLKPMTIGDLIQERQGARGPLHAGRRVSSTSTPASLDLPKRLPLPEVADHLVCSVCDAKNSDTYHPIWARPDARVPGVTGRYRDFNR